MDDRDKVDRFSSYEIMWSQDGHEPKPSSDGDWVRFSDYQALAARLAEVEAERNSFRAVLEGAEYGDIDGIAKNSPEQSRALGEVVKALTLRRLADKEAAESALARLRADQDAILALAPTPPAT